MRLGKIIKKIKTLFKFHCTQKFSVKNRMKNNINTQALTPDQIKRISAALEQFEYS